MQKIKRKKLQQEEDKIFIEEIEKSIMKEDRRRFHELETEKSNEMYFDSVDLLSSDLSPELTMEMVGTEFWNNSKLYSISKSKDFIPMSIFSEANQGKVAVEGTVTNKLDMIPHCGIEEYGKLCRLSNRKDRQIQVLENCRGEYLTPKPVMVEKRKKLKHCVKRTRGDRSEVEAKMFQLFERQPKWTLKQLLRETNQPMQFLREILKELCVYNARSRTHELKPEYKYPGEEGTAFAQ
ncbi:unnamed protein product [Arabis nemorensis]|uniref:TFIIF beta subunit HTH domain-containing protein n=1 Tax=Arabis nemorensis TaxID=586526 RepID=A0A565AS41_9BRAS|nr:unnamed protein product [Arabis nemorensis]